MGLLYGIQVIAALGLLIFVHELGHFLAAKWAGVRVEVFSFGFGPFLLSFKKGDTLYAVSLIPLGGYVRMTGQADIGPVKEGDKRLPHSYMAKSPGKRGVIIIAGVAMNMLLAYALFVIVLLLGMSRMPAEIGGVVPGSPAAAAGLDVREGDKILRIGSNVIEYWQHVELAQATTPSDEPIEVVLQREGRDSPHTVTITPRLSKATNYSFLGFYAPTQKHSFEIGISKAPGLGVRAVGPDTPGMKAGLKPMDYVSTIDGQPFDGLKEFKAALKRAGGGQVVLGILRKGKMIQIPVVPRDVGNGEYIVGFSSESVVGDVQPGSAAEKAGVKFCDFINRLQTVGSGSRVEMEYVSRDGATRTVALPVIPGSLAYVAETPKLVPVRSSFLTVWYDAGVETVDSLAMIYKVVAGLFARVTPLESTAGPIGIIGTTYKAAKAGINTYLILIAKISANLAVINLLPMVPLDGGILLFLLYEKLRGKPANPKFQEAAQLVGALLLLALIVLVTKNDITRYF